MQITLDPFELDPYPPPHCAVFIKCNYTISIDGDQPRRVLEVFELAYDDGRWDGLRTSPATTRPGTSATSRPSTSAASAEGSRPSTTPSRPKTAEGTTSGAVEPNVDKVGVAEELKKNVVKKSEEGNKEEDKEGDEDGGEERGGEGEEGPSATAFAAANARREYEMREFSMGQLYIKKQLFVSRGVRPLYIWYPVKSAL